MGWKVGERSGTANGSEMVNVPRIVCCWAIKCSADRMRYALTMKNERQRKAARARYAKRDGTKLSLVVTLSLSFSRWRRVRIF